MLHGQNVAATPSLGSMEGSPAGLGAYSDAGMKRWLLLRARSHAQEQAAGGYAAGPANGMGADIAHDFASSGEFGRLYTPAKAQVYAQMTIDCARKVIGKNQAAVITLFPFMILWVTEDSHMSLGVPTNMESLRLALEQKLSADDSAELAEKIIRSARSAELGIAGEPHTIGSLRSRSHRVDIDCYFKDPDLHCAVALLTPEGQGPPSAELHYEQAQLSSMRYHIGIMSNAHQASSAQSRAHASNEHASNSQAPNSHHHAAPRHASNPASTPNSQSNMGSNATSNTNSHSSSAHSATLHHSDPLAGHKLLEAQRDSRPVTTITDAQSRELVSALHAQHMQDFIPSMTCREVEYFYSLLPAVGSESYAAHETEAANSASIMEQEERITDPDHMDPHQKLRLLQAVPTVVAQRPRDLAEVRAEATAMSQRNIDPRRYLESGSGFAGYHMESAPAPPGPAYKKSDVSCLECGVDQSPEWRKGPMGPKTLCNRCGLRYAKKLRLQSK